MRIRRWLIKWCAFYGRESASPHYDARLTLDFGVVRASIRASETPRPRPTARQNGRRPRMLTRSVIGRGEDGVAVPVWCVRARQVCVRERARGVRAPRWAQREARAEGAGGPDPSAFGLLRRRCFTAPWAAPGPPPREARMESQSATAPAHAVEWT